MFHRKPRRVYLAEPYQATYVDLRRPSMAERYHAAQLNAAAVLLFDQDGPVTAEHMKARIATMGALFCVVVGNNLILDDGSRWDGTAGELPYDLALTVAMLDAVATAYKQPVWAR